MLPFHIFFVFLDSDPKTATSFTMDWLAQHDEIQMYTHELHALQSGNPAEFVEVSVNESDDGDKR